MTPYYHYITGMIRCIQEPTKKQDVLGAVEQQQRVGVIHASYMGTVVRL